MLDLCYLCGKPALHPLKLKNSFTAHSSARCPTSTQMCDRCYRTINGDWQIVFYFNTNKQAWSKTFSRAFSWLFLGDKLERPLIEGERTDGKNTLLIAANLLTRAEIRGLLLNPPEPPFTLAIAESGQKHILPWAREAHSRDHFPVQFELDTLFLNRAEFAALIEAYESLMVLDFSKTEIDSGDYRSDRLMKCLIQWETLEEKITGYRGTRLLQLVSYVAQRPEKQPEPVATAEVLEPVPKIEPTGQLTLF